MNSKCVQEWLLAVQSSEFLTAARPQCVALASCCGAPITSKRRPVPRALLQASVARPNTFCIVRKEPSNFNKCFSRVIATMGDFIRSHVQFSQPSVVLSCEVTALIFKCPAKFSVWRSIVFPHLELNIWPWRIRRNHNVQFLSGLTNLQIIRTKGWHLLADLNLSLLSHLIFLHTAIYWARQIHVRHKAMAEVPLMPTLA